MRTVDSLPFRAVIFDMDGVLLDSEPLHYEALRTVLARDGHEWTWKNNERLLGTTVLDSFRIIGEVIPLSAAVQSYIASYNDEVLAILNRPLLPQPGVTALLAQLAEAQVPVAVASSSLRSWIEATLTSLGIRNQFAVVVSGNDIDNGKPAPDIYLETARRLGLAPAECLAIEDAPNGILAANRASMPVIAVRTPYTESLSLDAADAVVASLADVMVEVQDGRFSITARHGSPC